MTRPRNHLNAYRLAALLVVLLAGMVGRVWAQCPTTDDFRDAVADWPGASSATSLVAIINDLPGWTLLLDSTPVGLQAAPENTDLGWIVEDQDLSFTVRHWPRPDRSYRPSPMKPSPSRGGPSAFLPRWFGPPSLSSPVMK